MRDEFDLLDADLPDPDDPANMSRRQLRHAQRAGARQAREDRKQEYRAKVRETRRSPRAPLALGIVGVLFFGGIFVVGSITKKDPAEVPLLTYPASGSTDAPVTPTATATPAAAFEDAATEWARAYFEDDDWEALTADAAVADLTAMRSTFFEPAEGAFLPGTSTDVADYGFRDVAQTEAGWTGKVDVLFGGERDIPVAASVTLTMTPDASEVVSAETTFYGQV